MARFNLKLSNIVKVIFVILLVVGVYNLAYNNDVFSYNMYEGFVLNTTTKNKLATNKKPATNNKLATNKKPATNNKPATKKDKEGFAGLFTSNDDQSINSSLMQPYASYKCGPVNIGKFFFDNVDFEPKCCPSTYSSSQGCACLCPQQINYLNSRGGNRTGATEY